MRRILEDDEFIRGNVPMTKKNIRLMVLAKLGLDDESVLVDFGAGTGSISIQASLDHACKIVAVEQKEEGIALIQKNAQKFSPSANLECITGRNESCVNDILEKNDVSHIFIGGSEGSLHNIIDTVIEYVHKCKTNAKSVDSYTSIRMVMTAVTLETIAEFQAIEETYASDIHNYELICVNIATSQKLGSYHLMKSENPVYICSFDIC